MISRKKWVLAILLLITILFLNVFSLTPLAIIISYLTLAVSTIGHFVFLLESKKIPKPVKTWYFIGLLLMCISIFTSYIHYGQSFVSGFIANINFYHVGSVIVFYYLFLKHRITFPSLFSILSKAGWLLLILIVIMAITKFAFINESELTGKLVIVSAGKVSKEFINLLAVFWFSKFLFKNNYKYLLYTILFFAGNHFEKIQRFAFVVTILTIGVGLLKNRNKLSNLKFILPVVFAIPFVGIYFNYSIENSDIIDRFIEASKIFTSEADDINDISAAIRISETEFAIEHFKLHPLFGNGFYRSSESDKVIGEDTYFYPSDVGIFGVLYNLGILGLVVFFGQIILLWKYLKIKYTNPYQFGSVLGLLFIITTSFLTGSTINTYQIFFFYVCLLSLSNVTILNATKHYGKI
tara:strand:+ start:269 stop:1495 length:1227 start_codon:yes stop_codon:yes gene_type:complete